MGTYCASKAALDHLSRCVALEESGKGIRVNVVSPGCIIHETMVKWTGNEPTEEG